MMSNENKDREIMVSRSLKKARLQLEEDFYALYIQDQNNRILEAFELRTLNYRKILISQIYKKEKYINWMRGDLNVK